MLSLNSSDPVFPGYPYGLIDADQHARISEQERQMLNLRMTVLLEKDKNKKMINNSLNSMNAHSILDRIKF
jgi:NurA-like 5'-3' nuclease